MKDILKHPFVATPDGGTCSSCGRSRINRIHDWTKSDVPALAPVSTRLRALLRSSPAIIGIQLTGDREVEVTHSPGQLSAALRSVEAAVKIMRADFRWDGTGSHAPSTIRITVT